MCCTVTRKNREETSEERKSMADLRQFRTCCKYRKHDPAQLTNHRACGLCCFDAQLNLWGGARQTTCIGSRIGKSFDLTQTYKPGFRHADQRNEESRFFDKWITWPSWFKTNTQSELFNICIKLHSNRWKKHWEVKVQSKGVDSQFSHTTDIF